MSVHRYHKENDYNKKKLSEYEDKYFLVSSDIENLISELFSVYLNKIIINADDQNSLYSVLEDNKEKNQSFEYKGIILGKSLQFYFNNLNDQKISVLDFFCNFTKDVLSNEVLAYLLKNKISNLLTGYVINLEFKFFSNESIYCLCVRNDINLFELFFPLATEEEESSKAFFTFDKNHKINQFIFVENDDFKNFWLSMDFDKIFKELLNNGNEDIALHIIKVISKIYDINVANKLSISSFKRLKESFRKNLKTLFEKEWFILIKFVLDYYLEDNNLFLLEDEPFQTFHHSFFCWNDLKIRSNQIKPNPENKHDNTTKDGEVKQNKTLIKDKVKNTLKKILYI